MALIDEINGQSESWLPAERLERQLRDYVDFITKLIWQRQGIFIAATLLASFYFNPYLTFACYSGVLFTEVLDLILFRQVQRWEGADPKRLKFFLVWVMVNTALSATMISLFVYLIATQQTSGGHFTPLFFLFAAALFAAMNNHQIVAALVLRLAIYFVTFIVIASMDIVRFWPPITSQYWLEFFTVIFVLYFIVDCSFVFLKLYRKALKQLEEIRLEHQRAKRAYEVKSQFLSTMSHELRTPLTSIKFSLDLMDGGTLGKVPDDLEPILGIALDNSKRLAQLINETLDLQKIESGEMVFRFQTVDLKRIVENSVKSVAAQAESQQVTVVTNFDDGEMSVRGDEDRIVQVMGNLLSNALKFSDEGGVITVRVQRVDDNVRVSVEDKGAGIPDDMEDKVFGRFSQVDSSDQRKIGGTGLGLNISKVIMEKHNGTIRYTSELGEGTTFFLDFSES